MFNFIWFVLASLLLIILFHLYPIASSIFLIAFILGEWLLTSKRYTHEAKILYQCLNKALPWHMKGGRIFGKGAQAIHLVLGLPKAGTTQLLSFCDVIPLSQKDVPVRVYRKGRKVYLVPHNNYTDNTPLTQIFKSLAQIKQYFPLQSIIITISVEQLQSNIHQDIETLLLASQTILKQWPWLSYQLAITQADKLNGFKEACHGLPIDTKKAPLGILFPQELSHEDTVQVVDQQMNYLCDQVQLLSPGEATFTQSLQALKPKLCAISASLSSQGLPIHGLFFTSTRYTPPLFVNDWLSQKHQPIVLQCHRKAHFRLFWFSLMFVSTCYTTHVVLEHEMVLMRKLNKILAAPHPLLTDRLNTLEHAQTLINTHKTSALSFLSQHLNNSVHEHYGQLLKNEFKIELKQHLEEALQDLSSESIKDFSTYLDFCADEVKHPDKIIRWFQQHNLQENKQGDYTRHMQVLLRQNFSCDTNKELISQVSQYIESIPRAKLIVLLTKNAFTKTNPGQEFFSISSQKTILDELLEQNFQEIIQLENSTMTTDDLKKAKQTYLNMYHEYWSKQLSELQNARLHSLTEIKNAFALWKNKEGHSKRLQIILAQTNGINQSKEFQSLVSQKMFGDITDKQNYQSIVQEWTNEFSSYIATFKDKQAIFHATQTRFHNYPNDQLTTLDKQLTSLPEAIKKPLTQISQATWHVMLETTRSALTQEWKSILSEHEIKQLEYFPLDNTADKEINVPQFVALFGPQGKLQQFIAANMKDFIESKEDGWHEKTIDSQALITNKIWLDWANAMSVMQTMLFSNSEQPNNTWELAIHQNTTESETLMQITQDDDTIMINENNQTIQLHIPDAIQSVTITQQSSSETEVKHYTGNWAWLRALNHAHIKKLKTEDNLRTLEIKFESQAKVFEITATTSPINALTSGLFKKIRPPEKLF